MARRGRRRRGETELMEVVNAHVETLVVALSEVIRRQVGDEIQRYFFGPDGRPDARGGKRKRRRILPCIAPGCKNPSKGPRFHFLCEKHMGAPKKEYEVWQAAAREKKEKAAAATTA